MQNVERNIIYVIYEQNGILDKWYEDLFIEFKNNGNYLLCVVNGEMCEDGKNLLDKYFNKVIYRENKGYDVTAYKEGILYLDKENMLNRELLLCNNSFFAPIYPFNEMFETMAKKDCDFWGITSVDSHKNIPFHIQSYFYLFKSNVVTSQEFINFFKNMKEIKSYQEAVDNVELKLSNYLINYGYKASSYMNEKIQGDYNHDQLTLIKNGCPILKRRKLVFSKRYGFNHGINNIGLFDYIEKNTSFPLSEIYINLTREFSYDKLDYCLNSNIIIDGGGSEQKQDTKTTYKIKYIISYNKKSSKIISQLQNKYKFIENIEYILTDSFYDILEKIKTYEDYDLYAHIGLVYRDFLPDEINFVLLEHMFISLLGLYHTNICTHILNNSYVGMAIPMDFFQGIKFNHIIKKHDKAYEILKKNNINIAKADAINILSLSSSFIIKKEIWHKLKNINYNEIGKGFASYVIGGNLLRYITHYQGLITIKVAENQQVISLINNYQYRYHNMKLEERIKAWYLTKKLKL